MATNGNNGGNINYNSPGRQNMGVTGSVQNRKTGREYNEKFYRETSGYLDNSIIEVQNLLKYYEQISGITKDLNKTEQNRFKKQQDALKEQLRTLEYVKDTREIDFEESVKLIKESNKLLISGSKEYQRIMEETQEIQSEADKEHLGSLDEAAQKMNNIRDNAEKTNQDLKDAAKVLNNTTSNLGDAISNTLKKSGDFAANLSNMLSLSSIANNTAEQALRKSLATQNSIMKQFGMSSESQYNQFKNSLTSTLTSMNNSMGNLFNADDMYTYFENLSEYGVTNQKVAEEQLKASVIGNKYLGVSNETQSLIFKFMKRTNNYDALNNHNKTIVGLLKSELGVSKEQLDALSEIAYEGNDSKSALGMSANAIYNQSEAMTTIGTAIESVYGSNASKAFEQALNDFIINPGDERWIQTLGANYHSVYNKLFTSQSYEEQLAAIKEFWNSLQDSPLLSDKYLGTDGLATSMGNKQHQELSALDDFLISALKGDKNAQLQEAEMKAINGVLTTTQKDVEDYVQDTTELTLIESLENKMSFTVDMLESWNNGVFSLANIALGLYIASGTVSTIGKIGSFLTKGGWSSTLGSTLGSATGGGGALSSLGTLLGSSGPLIGAVAAVGAVAAAIYAFNKSAADRTSRQTDTNASAIGNTISGYKSSGKSATESYSAGWDAFKQKDNGAFQQASEATAMFTTSTRLPNGTYSRAYSDWDSYVDSIANGSNNVNFSVSSNSSGSALEVFSYMDKSKRESLGLTPKAWQSGSTEAVKALQKYYNEKDAKSYNLIKAYTLASFLNQNPSIPADVALAAVSAAAILRGDGDDAIWSALNSDKTFAGAIVDDADTLKELMKSRGITRASELTAAYKALWDSKSVDFWLMHTPGKSSEWMGYPSEEELKEKFDLLKKGRMYIPYDNYPALLHEGEAVLTKAQAKKYRDNAYEYGVGGQSDSLYSNQQKIVLGKTIPSNSDVSYAGAQMGLPSGWTVTSGYGTYTSMRDSSGKIAKHRGIDFAAATGTEVRAAHAGTAYLASDSGYGNTVRIATASGLFNRYGHFSAFAPGLKSGMKVKRGQLIGYVGSTGNSTGPHLHFQVNKTNNERDDINPWPYIMMDIFGGSGSLGISGATSSSSSTATTTMPKVTTRRFINGANAMAAGGAEANIGGADRVVNSVDGGFNRLIAYLDNISKRQDEQQVLLEAFSKSRNSGKDI